MASSAKVLSIDVSQAAGWKDNVCPLVQELPSYFEGLNQPGILSAHLFSGVRGWHQRKSPSAELRRGKVNTRPRRILPGTLWILAFIIALIAGIPALILPKSPLFAQTAEPAPAPQENRKTKFTVPPEYPELAKKNNISGTARVQAVIAPDGTVKEVKVLGGSPVLVQAVVDAVKKWRYEPAPAATTAVLKFDFKPQ